VRVESVPWAPTARSAITFPGLCIAATWRSFATKRVEGWDGSKAKDGFSLPFTTLEAVGQK
jgi:hypothetical protein